MSDITPGTTHWTENGMSKCGIEYTSDWDEDDDAEFAYTYDIRDVDCVNCLSNIKYEASN